MNRARRVAAGYSFLAGVLFVALVIWLITLNDEPDYPDSDYAIGACSDTLWVRLGKPGFFSFDDPWTSYLAEGRYQVEATVDAGDGSADRRMDDFRCVAEKEGDEWRVTCLAIVDPQSQEPNPCGVGAKP